ncbi:hypothetical protein HHI36_000622 [Cryptolaemus montrouzieri]|uniref:Ig-like domain-containing protein n=1 Tax=Cryptolaemus montrouzieri TaxID=559131 RepID=A0ABD2P5A2_9CUCU
MLVYCTESSSKYKSYTLLSHYSMIRSTSVTKNNVIHLVQAIEKGAALLPCDLTTTKAGDHVVLVVWYKDEHTPIYSYDVRSPHTNQAKHWRGESLETRAFFRTMTEPATLSLDNISEKDEGEYRCRIDYSLSATKNYRVKLSVLVPPQKPTIIDEKGKEVTSVAGPYEEGGDMKLTCIVTGGEC